MTDRYAESDIWPNPPASQQPARPATLAASEPSRVLGEGSDAQEALVRVRALADAFADDGLTRHGGNIAWHIEEAIANEKGDFPDAADRRIASQRERAESAERARDAALAEVTGLRDRLGWVDESNARYFQSGWEAAVQEAFLRFDAGQAEDFRHEQRAALALPVTGDLCHHCGQGPDDDGDHTCPCPHSDEDCPDHSSPAAASEPLTTERLGDNIRRAIKAAGLTQAEVAERSEIDPTALSKIVNGKRKVSSLELALICTVTQTDVMTLLEAEALHGPSFRAGMQYVRDTEHHPVTGDTEDEGERRVCSDSPRYFPQLVCERPKGHEGDHHDGGEYRWAGDTEDASPAAEDTPRVDSRGV